MCYFRHIKTGLAQSPLRLILALGQTIPNASRDIKIYKETNKKNINALKFLQIKKQESAK